MVRKNLITFYFGFYSLWVSFTKLEWFIVLVNFAFNYKREIFILSSLVVIFYFFMYMTAMCTSY
jgi:uncharacterized protein YhhL (DUF1145 family)